MKNLSLIAFLLLGTFCLKAQEITFFNEAKSNKGKMYAYWGWNRGSYSKSDIRFEGDGYSFTLHDVVAKDRQTPFEIKTHLNPGKITIPQTNARIGYFISDKYDVSLGVDHMKYVMTNDQTVRMEGQIDQEAGSFNGTYTGQDQKLTADFLTFEHTDGLNYVNAEIRRHDNVLNWEFADVNFISGAGLGVLYPKTNATVMGSERYDDFDVSGFGLNLVTGLSLVLWDHLLIQYEAKAGYIHMPNIRTTHNTADKASQRFFFFETVLNFGYQFRLFDPKK